MICFKYKYLSAEINHGTEELPDIKQMFIEKTATSEALAKQEAYNGEYEPVEIELPVHEQIAELKAQLSATDYRVIKCSECQLLGQELPYDVAELHAERQAIRDQINQLEQTKN